IWDFVQQTLAQRGLKSARLAKHNFTYSGLVNCGHCGCLLVGEIKKGKYTYYRCSGGHGRRCDEPYLRQEVLEEKLEKALAALVFDAEVLGWFKTALLESHAEKKAFHDAAVAKLNAAYARLQHRLDEAYLDKLDGRITAEDFDRRAAEWR